jgi:hypothetical protein
LKAPSFTSFGRFLSWRLVGGLERAEMKRWSLRTSADGHFSDLG